MHLILKRDWKVGDGRDGSSAVIPVGRHEVERVRCPLGHDCNWLVLKGTLIGGAEGFWRDWRNGDLNDDGQPIDWGEFEVVVEE
jgi:hypothetical protein